MWAPYLAPLWLTLGVQGQDNRIDIGQPALPLPDDHRLERPVAVPGHVDLHIAERVGQQRLRPFPVPGVAPVATSRLVLVVAEALGHLLIQRGLDHRLGQRLEQTMRPGQCDTP